MSDRETDRMPLGLVFEWFRHEAEAAHDDSWVVAVELGAVRTVVAALRRLNMLESSVEDLTFSCQDGSVEERRVFHLEHCGGCDCLRLKDRPKPAGDG